MYIALKQGFLLESILYNNGTMDFYCAKIKSNGKHPSL